MRKILNLHRMNTSNIGDLMCAPVLYFEELASAERAEIRGFHRSEGFTTTQRKEWLAKLKRAELLIIGGGGLLEIDYFSPSLVEIFTQISPGTKTVFWGGGHNNWKLSDWRRLKQEINIAHLPFDLVGVRDAGHKFDWVPCATCMHRAFDLPSDPSVEVVVYAHSATVANENFRGTLPKGMPILTNSSPFADVIEFIGNADLILTDSYHGMYWATIMGKRVIAFPSSSKFYDAKHPVPLCDPSDWRRFEPMARRYPEALEECRHANALFLSKVLNL